MNAIVVTDKQWAIGRSGDLLFSLPGDMKHFRTLTTGGTVIMATHDLDFAGTYSDEAAFLCNRVVTPPRPRRAFFAGMELYTTGVRRVTCRALPDAVSPEDLVL